MRLPEQPSTSDAPEAFAYRYNNGAAFQVYCFSSSLTSTIIPVYSVIRDLRDLEPRLDAQLFIDDCLPWGE